MSRITLVASELQSLQCRRILTPSITQGVTSSMTSAVPADIKMVHDMESIHHVMRGGETMMTAEMTRLIT